MAAEPTGNEKRPRTNDDNDDDDDDATRSRKRPRTDNGDDATVTMDPPARKVAKREFYNVLHTAIKRLELRALELYPMSSPWRGVYASVLFAALDEFAMSVQYLGIREGLVPDAAWEEVGKFWETWAPTITGFPDAVHAFDAAQAAWESFPRNYRVLETPIHQMIGAVYVSWRTFHLLELVAEKLPWKIDGHSRTAIARWKDSEEREHVFQTGPRPLTFEACFPAILQKLATSPVEFAADLGEAPAAALQSSARFEQAAKGIAEVEHVESRMLPADGALIIICDAVTNTSEDSSCGERALLLAGRVIRDKKDKLTDITSPRSWLKTPRQLDERTKWK